MKQNVPSIVVGFGFLICCSLNVQAGQDQKSAFVTPGPGTSVDFGNVGTPAIPADFFGPGSDPFDGAVGFQGAANPATPCDTDIVAGGPVICPGAGFPRSCDQVSIEIVALDLKSIDPMTVTFNGGQNPESWDVALILTVGAQPQGTLDATLEHANGGTFDCSLPILPRFVFTPTGGGVDLTGDFDQVTLQLTGPWVINVNPNLGVFAPNDGDFVAGVDEVSPGDPSSQVVQPVNGDSGGGVTHRVEIAPSPPIPTVTEWGMLAMVLLMLAAGTVVYRRLRLEGQQVA